MTERWRQVGKQLGLELPEQIGKIILPLFDREQEGGLTIVDTSDGPVVARLADRDGLNKAGMRNLVLTTAVVTPRRWAVVETHAPHPKHIQTPGGPLSGAVQCRMADYNRWSVMLGPAPRTGAGVGTDIPYPRGGTDEKIYNIAVARLDPFVNGEGVDLFHPDNAAIAHDTMHAEFATHIFGQAVRLAMTERFDLPPQR